MKFVYQFVTEKNKDCGHPGVRVGRALWLNMTMAQPCECCGAMILPNELAMNNFNTGLGFGLNFNKDKLKSEEDGESFVYEHVKLGDNVLTIKIRTATGYDE